MNLNISLNISMDEKNKSVKSKDESHDADGQSNNESSVEEKSNKVPRFEDVHHRKANSADLSEMLNAFGVDVYKKIASSSDQKSGRIFSKFT